VTTESEHPQQQIARLLHVTFGALTALGLTIPPSVLGRADQVIK
jgi:hypothetical protein